MIRGPRVREDWGSPAAGSGVDGINTLYIASNSIPHCSCSSVTDNANGISIVHIAVFIKCWQLGDWLRLGTHYVNGRSAISWILIRGNTTISSFKLDFQGVVVYSPFPMYSRKQTSSPLSTHWGFRKQAIHEWGRPWENLPEAVISTVSHRKYVMQTSHYDVTTRPEMGQRDLSQVRWDSVSETPFDRCSILWRENKDLG